MVAKSHEPIECRGCYTLVPFPPVHLSAIGVIRHGVSIPPICFWGVVKIISKTRSSKDVCGNNNGYIVHMVIPMKIEMSSQEMGGVYVEPAQRCVFIGGMVNDVADMLNLGRAAADDLGGDPGRYRTQPDHSLRPGRRGGSRAGGHRGRP